MLPLLQPPPPAVVASAPTASQEAETALLNAFDLDLPLPPEPRLKGSAALDYRWLRTAATFAPDRDLPAVPFAPGAARREAEALRHLLATPGTQTVQALNALPLRHAGTALALWRWGRLQVRTGAFPPPLRRAWEDRLLAAGPPLTRGYALRHALCWALAENDEARFGGLRSQAGSNTAGTLVGFQRLFGLLGGPPPELRLWTLPDLVYRDASLAQRGPFSRFWICPAEEGPLPDIPAGTLWIIPSLSGALDEREATLTPELRAEGLALADRFAASGRTGQFAPSRAAFEKQGLAWFPILIELDAQRRIAAIRMGDAAPARP